MGMCGELQAPAVLSAWKETLYQVQGSNVDPSAGFDNRSAFAGQHTNRCHVL